MAVPKRKLSKQRSNKRFANWKIESPSISQCPQCHELKQNHRVCLSCGYYQNVQRIEVIKNKKNNEN